MRAATLALAAVLLASIVPAGAQQQRSSSTISSLPSLSNLTGNEVVPADQGTASTSVTGSLTLNALAAFVGSHLPAAAPVVLSGNAAIPLAGRVTVEAAPAAVLTLPAGAPPGTVVTVSDRQGSASAANPITIRSSFDAALLEASPYTLVVPNESMSFRKTADGTAWQPF